MIMNVFVCPCLILFVLVATVSGYELTTNPPLKHLDWRNPFWDYVNKKIPNGAFRSASYTSLGTPSGYIITTVMQGTSCDGNAVVLTGGVGMDVCYTAQNDQGEPIGSIYFDFDGTEHPLLINARVFDGVIDCNGNLFQDYEVPIPDTCIATDDSLLSYSFSYTEQSDPWKMQPAGGLLQQAYDTAQHCKDYNSMGMYTLINTNVCAYSIIITGCSGDSYTVQFYGDRGCNIYLSENKMSLETCYPYDLNPSNYTVDVLGYGSLFCNQ